MADERSAWVDGGLTDPENRLQRPGFAATWWTPETVWLEGKRLRWDPVGERQRVVPPADLFDLFVNLASASDERVLEFARTYGVVYLCEQHEKPLGHGREVGADPEFEPYPCDILGAKQPFTPVQFYVEFAKTCRAILNIAKNLGDDVAGEYQDWFVLDPDYARVPEVAPEKGSPWRFIDVLRAETPRDNSSLVQSDRDMIAKYLDHWLDTAGVRFRLDWPNGPTPQFDVRVTSLWGALVTSLAMTLTRGGLATCSACGRAYTPKRRPAASRRNYCNDKTCQTARKTYATTRSRAKRQKAAKE